ncbi:MAG: baseplate multidomain protein megatron [Maritimibacter sp.]
MATIVLSAIGAAAGASIGGGVLGLSSVVIGRAIGAVAGRVIDQKILGAGSDPVETGKVDRLRISGASEGAPVPQLYARHRIGGQVIWASEVSEHVNAHSGEGDSGSGKGFLSGPRNSDYSYTMSVAVALCEGEISHVGRVWADGEEIAPDSVNMTIYTGSDDQLPDPTISAIEGADDTPAYRGVAYVVLENLDLTRFGNRMPLLNFEVFRPEQPDEAAETARGTKAVAIIPGTGEYALATTAVHYGGAPGEAHPVNTNSPLGKTDFAASLDMMAGELPNCESGSLVVSWFGDDLRANTCQIAPKVESHTQEAAEMPWTVSGILRAQAGTTPTEEGRPVYGGTPTDQSVKEAIVALTEQGKAVTFYPFILMEQMEGNGLIDPYSGAPDQPKLPWRGRITTSLAPGMQGSPDGTAAATAEVAAFFGAAQPGDFVITEDGVDYTGPAEWSYRRFILHYAHLCASAGGVEAFLIGSELRGLTQIRGANTSFPVVEQLIQLAADVRSILGAGTKISYAADWSEYFGYHPQDGSGDLLFHLDPLWMDANIDFIGIDNYMPLSDWREGHDHADAHWGSIHNIDYLKANILGGEGYDWYYHAPEAEAVQLRTPITDGEYFEPWVWRYKDIKSWWNIHHHERIGGVRNLTSTSWVPGSKPIWFTEMGCAAIDKGTNEPNKFLDPKSSESSLPKYSNGRRDDFMQAQYLRAMREFWDDPVNNPTHNETGVRMIDMSRAAVWAWDARPYPWFPGHTELWSDGSNYARGHWLNGRSTTRSLASIVGEICRRSGVTDYDVSRLYGAVRGYVVSDVTTGRAALQPLMLAYGFEAAEREGVLTFFSRDGLADGTIEAARLAVTEDLEGAVELTRAPEAEMAGRVRLTFTESDGEYETSAAEAVFPDEVSRAISGSELPLVLTQTEARAITERWLAEARVARDTARFALPPSDMEYLAGDTVELETDAGTGLFRIDRVEQADVQIVDAVRVEPGSYEPGDAVDNPAELRSFRPVVPVLPLFLDLPLLTGDEVPHAPHVAVSATPWPGPVGVFSAPADFGYLTNTILGASARIGITETELLAARPGLFDHGPALQVRLASGTLSALNEQAILNGANVAAIGNGDPAGWEVFQFTKAELVAPNLYELTGRLRAQAGTESAMPEVWPIGSYIVFLDSSVRQIDLSLSARGLERHYRVGPTARSIDDATYRHEVHAFDGIGLRPLSPVHLKATPNAGGYDLSWIRRTRLDGDSWQGVEVPLGEDAEAYQIKVLGGGGAGREVSVSNASWTYSAAMMAQDGVAPPFQISVAQVSASFGAGPAQLITIST